MRSRWSQIAAAAVLLMVLIGGLERLFIRIYFLDRRALRAHLTELPYRRMPGYRQLLEDSAKHTRDGETIAIWVRSGRWDQGYEYAYHRAAYRLPHARVVPLIDEQNRFLSANLGQSQAIVCWQCEPPFPGFRVVFRTPAGVLARR